MSEYRPISYNLTLAFRRPGTIVTIHCKLYCTTYSLTTTVVYYYYYCIPIEYYTFINILSIRTLLCKLLHEGVPGTCIAIYNNIIPVCNTRTSRVPVLVPVHVPVYN